MALQGLIISKATKDYGCFSCFAFLVIPCLNNKVYLYSTYQNVLVFNANCFRFYFYTLTQQPHRISPSFLNFGEKADKCNQCLKALCSRPISSPSPAPFSVQICLYQSVSPPSRSQLSHSGAFARSSGDWRPFLGVLSSLCAAAGRFEAQPPAVALGSGTQLINHTSKQCLDLCTCICLHFYHCDSPPLVFCSVFLAQKY